MNGTEETKQLAPETVYENLLSRLTLEKDHRDSLVQRGLAPKEIDSLQYKSIPQRRKAIVEGMARDLGQQEILRSATPGFYTNDRGELELAGRSGIAIPVRSYDGKIQSIKIRTDRHGTSKSKYLLLSSNPESGSDGKPRYLMGTAARAHVHYPLNRPRQCRTLRITEGELKADIASSMTEVYTISLPGITSWRKAFDAIKLLKPEHVLLSFDSDKANPNHPAYNSKDTPPSDEEEAPAADRYAVGKAVSSLYFALKSEGASYGVKEVSIEDWPAEAGKGIDDVLMAGATDKIRLLTGPEAEEFARAMLTETLPEGWVYVVGVKRFYHTETLVELDKEQYADRFLHTETGNPASNALRNPAMLKVDNPIYMPQREIIFQDGSHRLFNTWRPGTLQPMQGDIAPFFKHCEYILPDKREREIFLDWLAFNVQNPGKKILWAVLLKGEPGTGKSYFGTLMRWILGEKNVSCPTNEMIHEIYTAWIKSCQLVVIEEIMARGRLELMNKLKPMITQPSTIVREMHKPAYEQPNVFNILMFTNHNDALLIDREDRRYCVLFSPAKPREHRYYAELWDWTRESKAAIMHHLVTRDLSKFQPLAHAPMTEGKTELISEGMTDVQAWVSDGIEEESWPFQCDLVGINHLVECAPRNLRNVSRQTVTRALKVAGARRMKSPTLLNSGGQVRLWTIRRHELWDSAERSTLAHEYERWASVTQEPGGNPMADARPM